MTITERFLDIVLQQLVANWRVISVGGEPISVLPIAVRSAFRRDALEAGHFSISHADQSNRLVHIILAGESARKTSPIL